MWRQTRTTDLAIMTSVWAAHTPLLATTTRLPRSRTGHVSSSDARTPRPSITTPTPTWRTALAITTRPRQGVQLTSMATDPLGRRTCCCSWGRLAKRAWTEGALPSRQPEQIINQNIKVLGALAGINSPVTIEQTIGGRKVRRRYPKHDLIKTHTARRSFCTNAYHEGLDCLDIMAVSGHTSEANFLKYIKVTRRERAKRIAYHPSSTLVCRRL